MGCKLVFEILNLLPVEVEIAAMQKPAYDANLAMASSVMTREKNKRQDSPDDAPDALARLWLPFSTEWILSLRTTGSSWITPMP